MGSLYCGTSGFSYKEWKPEFYPDDLPQARFLDHYASVLSSVEINNTFYRAPTERLLKGWIDKTPPPFRLTLKAPQAITHRRRLADVDEQLSYFLDVAKVLGERLGAILFQCPPSLRYDADTLNNFLAALPGEPFRFAMEFRHASWNIDEVRDALARTGVAWCVAETEAEHPMIRTAKRFVYLRLRKDDYADAEIERWAKEVRAVLDDGADAYVYFKHEDGARAPAWARRLLELTR